MTTTTKAPAGRLDFCGRLTLPSGEPFGSAFSANEWLIDILNLCLSGQYSQVWVELARGCAKTTSAAAISLTECIATAGTHCFVVAADREQAGILLQALSGLIRRSRDLLGAINQTRQEFKLGNGSFIKVMSSDSPSFFGLGASAQRVIIIADEVGQWPQEHLWHAAISTLGKHADNRLIALTNAGLKDTWQVEARDRLKAAGGKVFALPGCPASWISPEQLAQMRASLPEALYRRYYENEWVSGIQDAAISPEQWDACQGTIPELTPNVHLVIGVDAGVASDTFAVIAVSKQAEKPRYEAVSTLPDYTTPPAAPGYAQLNRVYPTFITPVKAPEPHILVRAVQVWEPPSGGLDFSLPFEWLYGFCRSHRVAQVAYDNFQLWDFMTRLQRDAQVWCEPFSQMTQRSQADADLLALIRSKRLHHDGDETLRAHALNASLKLAAREDTRARLVKSAPARKIDAIIATSMAASEALRLNIG